MNGVSKLALVLIVVGTVLVAAPAFGFTSFAADRGVGVSTTEGSDAYLGFESNDDETDSLRGDSGSLEVGTLSNNFSEELVVEDVSVASVGDDSVDDEIIAVAEPNTGDGIDATDETAVSLECSDDESVDEQDVVINVERITGSTVTVAEPTITTTVDIQCGQGQFTGSSDLDVSDLPVDETTQTVSFDTDALGNNDEATVDFSEPQSAGGVDYSNVTDDDLEIESDEHKGDVSFDTDTSQLTYLPQGNEDGQLEITVENIDLSGESGGSYLVSYSDETGQEDGTYFEIE